MSVLSLCWQEQCDAYWPGPVLGEPGLGCKTQMPQVRPVKAHSSHSQVSTGWSSRTSLKSASVQQACQNQEVGQSKDDHAPGQGSRSHSLHQRTTPKREAGWLAGWLCARGRFRNTCVASMGPVGEPHVPGHWVQQGLGNGERPMSRAGLQSPPGRTSG